MGAADLLSSEAAAALLKVAVAGGQTIAPLRERLALASQDGAYAVQEINTQT